MPSKCQVRLPKVLTCQEFLKHPSLVTYYSSRQRGGYFDFAHLLHPNWGDDGCRICTGKPDTSRRLYFDFPGLWIELSSEFAHAAATYPPQPAEAPRLEAAPGFVTLEAGAEKTSKGLGIFATVTLFNYKSRTLIDQTKMTDLHLWNPLLVRLGMAAPWCLPTQTDPVGATSQSDPLKRVGRRAKATRTRLETMLEHSSGKSWFVAGCSWNGPYKAMCSLQIMCLKWQYSWTLLLVGSNAFFWHRVKFKSRALLWTLKNPWICINSLF